MVLTHTLLAAAAVDPDRTWLITNPVAVLGILMIVLAVVFKTSDMPRFKRFYGIVPAILLCYFIPGLLNTTGLVADIPTGDATIAPLYWMASRVLLPACLVLLTVAIDLPAILRLGPKLLLLFFTSTVGIIIGGPLALGVVWMLDPSLAGGEGPDALWKGFSTVAGSWIGGGANQTAMKEIFLPSDDLFSAMIAVDVIVANIWMGFLLWMAGRQQAFDRWLKADRSAVDQLTEKVRAMRAGRTRIPTAADYFVLLAVAIGIVGLCSLIAGPLAAWFSTNWPAGNDFSLGSTFFWLIVLSTTLGLAASFWHRARSLEDVGASRLATVFLYTLVAVIGLKMDLRALVDAPVLFLIGFIWIAFQGGLLFAVAKLVRAPSFFIAVSSQANIGGAASAPVVAGAFSPWLAPVGALLAVLGYAVGTYGALLCAHLMRLMTQGDTSPSAETDHIALLTETMSQL
ncbi:MAG: DUF819 family protein, partial [Phycisphaerales bacterium]|nr:DUF819 family protein [Phycisphaerales bacterium]